MSHAPTPILTAVYRGKPEEIATALGGRPAPTVFEAAALGDTARVRALAAADAGAVARRSPDGWPPLHLAAHFGHGDAVDALLEARADVHARSTNAEGNTALHAALAGRASARILSRLLARGADVNARAAGGHTALHEAAFRGHLELAQILLAHGADAAARNDDGQTPLDIAEAKGHAALARRLRGELP
ncbi:MAG TPA: ankyrin repeat domain-containing protein [Candidatus Binatia bacterium]|nr:ankyrin repeat domain-containing protein [Candidatus Binatia bacterium]